MDSVKYGLLKENPVREGMGPRTKSLGIGWSPAVLGQGSGGVPSAAAHKARLSVPKSVCSHSPFEIGKRGRLRVSLESAESLILKSCC